MSNDVIIALIGSGLVGAVVSGLFSLVRVRSENRNQDANTMKVVQEVYGQTITDVRTEVEALRAKVRDLEAELRVQRAISAQRDARIRQLTATLIEHRISVPPDHSNHSAG